MKSTFFEINIPFKSLGCLALPVHNEHPMSYNTKKNSTIKCVLVVAWLPQRLKSRFFEIFLHSWFPLGPAPGHPINFFSKNVDFSLWGKQCILLRRRMPYMDFFRVLAHCAAAVYQAFCMWFMLIGLPFGWGPVIGWK